MWVLQAILAIIFVLIGTVIGFMIFAARVKSVGTLFLDGQGTAYIKFHDDCSQATLEQRRLVMLKIMHVENSNTATYSRPTVE